MSRTKDLQWAIWEAHTQELDHLLWELGRIEGLRQGAMMAGCLRAECDSQQYQVVKRHIEATVRDIRTEANKLSKKWRRRGRLWTTSGSDGA